MDHGKTGINQYDYFLNTVNNAFKIKDIDGDGKIDHLIPSGIIWMQGESDGLLQEAAIHYYEHLTDLIDLIRKAFHTEDMPIVIGKISDSGNSKNGKVWRIDPRCTREIHCKR